MIIKEEEKKHKLPTDPFVRHIHYKATPEINPWVGKLVICNLCFRVVCNQVVIIAREIGNRLFNFYK